MNILEIDYEDLGFDDSIRLVGHTSLLPPEREREAIERLHQAIKDVTGKPVEQQPKPRIGFLP